MQISLSLLDNFFRVLLERKSLQHSASKVWNKLLKLASLLLTVECAKPEKLASQTKLYTFLSVDIVIIIIFYHLIISDI